MQNSFFQTEKIKNVSPLTTEEIDQISGGHDGDHVLTFSCPDGREHWEIDAG
jgi:hypothetical protein